MKIKTNGKRRAKAMTRLILAFLTLSIIAMLIFSSCGAASSDKEGAFAPQMPEAGGDYVYKDDLEQSGDYIDDGFTYGGADDALTTDRKIIKTVRQTVQTTDYSGFVDAMRGRIAELGGYISDATYNDSAYGGGARYASLTIRIPAERLDSFTATAREIGTVVYHNESANDITASYIDIDSRISVLAAEEKSLLAMLEKTETLEDTLTVKKQLSNVQGELASLRAQKNSYDSRIAFSTVFMTVNEVKTIEPPAEQGFGEELGARFHSSLEAIGGFFRGLGIWLLGDSPIIIILLAVGVGIFLLVRYIMRRAKRNREERKNNDEAED